MGLSDSIPSFPPVQPFVSQAGDGAEAEMYHQLIDVILWIDVSPTDRCYPMDWAVSYPSGSFSDVRAQNWVKFGFSLQSRDEVEFVPFQTIRIKL